MYRVLTTYLSRVLTKYSDHQGTYLFDILELGDVCLLSREVIIECTGVETLVDLAIAAFSNHDGDDVRDEE